MTINEVPEKYKIYTICMSNKQEFKVTGIELESIFKSESNIIQLKNGEIFNKAFFISCPLDKELTKENVKKNRDQIISELDLIKSNKITT